MRSANRYVWSAALSQAKNESGRMVCANVFGLRWSTKLLALMECAARSSYSVMQPWKACPGNRFESPGSTVVSSHSSPADRAENHPLRSRRWSVDMGIANAISKPGLSQALSAGQSGGSRTGQRRGPIGFILGEHGPGHARQLPISRSPNGITIPRLSCSPSSFPASIAVSFVYG